MMNDPNTWCHHKRLNTSGMRASIRLLLSTLVFLQSCFFWAALDAAASTDTNILLISAYHEGYLWSDHMVGGIRETLETKAPPPRLFIEHLDSKRINSPPALDLLAALIQEKYRQTAFAAVIAADDNSLRFLKKYRQSLFAGIPAVFCGANDLNPAVLDGMTPITGVNEAADVRETIGLALRMIPATRRIVVVNDTTPTGRNVHREIERVAKAFTDNVSFAYWEDLPREDLLQRLSGLQRGDIVLYTFFFRDSDGRFYEYDDSAREICSASPVPVFSLWEFNLGHGIVGGKLVSGYEQGLAAGRMALRIINGKTADSIPLLMKSPNRFAFDYRMLKKFDLDVSLLPPQSVIINKPPTIYEQHKELFWGAMAVFFFLLSLSLFLIVLVTKGRGKQRFLLEQRQFLEDITGNLPGVVNQFYVTSNGEFGLNYIDERSADILELSTSLESFFTTFVQRIHEADRERFFASIDEAVKQFSPWYYEGRYIKPSGAVMWFSGNSVPRRENDRTVFDGVIMDITENKVAEERLRTSERLMSQIINFFPDPMFVINCDSQVIAWNRAMETLSGIPAESMLGKGDYEYALPFYDKRRPIMIDLVMHWDDGIAEEYHNLKHIGDILVSETADPSPTPLGRQFRNVAGPLLDDNGEMIGAIESIHDITTQRREIKTLEQREELLRFFVEHTPIAVAMCDLNMTYLSYSRRWITDFDLPDEDLTGRCHYDVFDPIPDHWKEEHRRCLQGESIQKEEEAFIRADGSTDWVRRILHPWRTKEGDVNGIIILVELTTEKKQAQEEIHKRQIFLESVLYHAPDAIITLNDRHQVVDWNPGAETIFGYTPKEAIGNNLTDLVAGEDTRSQVEENIQNTLSGQRVETYETVRYHKDGRPISVLVGGSPIIVDETLTGVVVVYRDISAIKQAQDEIGQRQMFLESVLHQAPDAIIVMDARHRVTDWNPGAETIFGYTRSEALGKALPELVADNETQAEVEANIRTIEAGRRLEAFDAVRYRKDGTPIHVIAASSPIIRDGKIVAVVAMYTDITVLKHTEDELRRKERMLRRIMDIVPSMIFVKNAQGRFLMANQAVADSYGICVEELVGKLQSDVHPNPDQVKRYLADDQRALQTNQAVFVHEEPFEDQTGRTRWLEVTKLPCDPNDFGEPAVVGLAMDITERREAKSRLQESEKHYRTMFENTGTGTVLSEMDMTLSMVNREFAQMVGYTRDEIEGKIKWTEFIAPEDIERMKTYHFNRRKDPSNTPTQFECSLVDRSGRTKPMLLKARLIPGTQTSIGAFLDISDRKRTEAALVTANRMLRLVLDTIPVYVFWKDTACRYLGCNRPFAENAGFSDPEALIGRNDYELVWIDQAPAYRRDDRAVMATGQARLNFEEKQTTASGETVWVQTSKVPMRDDKDNIIGVLGTFQDITERKRANEELQRLRNYLSNIINSMPSVLIGVDSEVRVTQWNKQAEKHTGLPFEKAHRQPLTRVFPRLADELTRIRSAIEDRQVLRNLKIPRQHRGGTRFEDITIFPLEANGVEGAVIRLDDVTEQVRMEEMMIQSEKMLSVGGLAAGMAHEINNPLAGILQNTAVLENRLFGDLPANRKTAETVGISFDAMREYLELRSLPTMLENIRASGNRAAAIVRNMLSFARKSDLVISSHDLGRILDQTIELAQTDYDMKKHYDFKQIRIIREYDEAAPPVPCESSKIQQVFLNILKNGAEAMAEETDKTKPPIFFLRVKNDRGWVRVEIEDNGPGMEEATRHRIFEPFFTTKPVGRGTGLGLSVSYFIIAENHGGKMDVHKVDGGGSRFVIQLPKSGKTVSAP